MDPLTIHYFIEIPDTLDVQDAIPWRSPEATPLSSISRLHDAVLCRIGTDMRLVHTTPPTMYQIMKTKEWQDRIQHITQALPEFPRTFTDLFKTITDPQMEVQLYEDGPPSTVVLTTLNTRMHHAQLLDEGPVRYTQFIAARLKG